MARFGIQTRNTVVGTHEYASFLANDDAIYVGIGQPVLLIIEPVGTRSPVESQKSLFRGDPQLPPDGVLADGVDVKIFEPFKRFVPALSAQAVAIQTVEIRS